MQSLSFFVVTILAFLTGPSLGYSFDDVLQHLRAQKYNRQLTGIKVEKDKLWDLRSALKQQGKPSQPGVISINGSTTMDAVFSLPSSDLKKTAVLHITNSRHPASTLSGGKGQGKELGLTSALRFAVDREFQNTTLTIDKREVIFSENVPLYKRLSKPSFPFFGSAPTTAFISSAALTRRRSDRGLGYYKKAMISIMETQVLSAIRHGKDILVLGSFGCGARRGRPQEVANMYKEVLEKYRYYFRQIIFPIVNPTIRSVFASTLATSSSSPSTFHASPSYYSKAAHGYKGSDLKQLYQTDFQNLQQFVRNEIFDPKGSLSYLGGLVSSGQKTMWHKTILQLMPDAWRKSNPWYTPTYRVLNQDTLEAALRIKKNFPGEKVAVLNMANKQYPCGGVKHGSVAQEEELCRRSLLSYYLFPEHNKVLFPDGTYRIHDDGVIYTHDVAVLVPRKSRRSPLDFQHDVYPSPVPTVDVISSAAVNMRSTFVKGKMSEDDYSRTMGRKIHAQIAAAAVEDVMHLVLGAFGCGAFGGYPKVVALKYRKALQNYEGHFKSVTFAILVGNSDLDTKRIDAFREEFSSLIAKGSGTSPTSVAPMLA